MIYNVWWKSCYYYCFNFMFFCTTRLLLVWLLLLLYLLFFAVQQKHSYIHIHVHHFFLSPSLFPHLSFFLSPFTVKKQHGNVRWGHGGRVHCTIPVKLICNPYFFLKILIKKYNNTLKRGSFIIDWPILDSPRMVRFSVQGLHLWRTILFNAARVFQILIYSVLHMF